ncbi:hypothetical protein PTT_19908 [Pyrenophora teres f. teres 0-1]|uniref:Uncharacterized protein n=1 Tax=Pyrenophora teres f. teres (strain 0-1) TaxID=861557 RepID=E3S9Z7_PYRTT|nr:hypothetical protein PTT_19908 [Pyrenophora teres f. teres 0-1]
MGRTEKSQGLAPLAIRKDIRAKQARHVINKIVPAILASNARARKGADHSELIADPGCLGTAEKEGIRSKDHAHANGGEDVGYIKRKGQGRRKAKGGGVEDEYLGKEDGAWDSGKGKAKGKDKRRNDSLEEDLSSLTMAQIAPLSPKKERSIRIIATDTLTAAHMLTHPSLYNPATPSKLSNKKSPNTCILNMASPLRPGGGVLAGATSQEEYLCARTTLLPSLKENFYRLPELGGIYTPDVLVFRNSLSLGDNRGELPPTKRWYIDVVSAGMLRFPELEGEEDEVKRLGKKDRQLAEAKIRAVLRIMERKGVEKVVLGAWGCGAYGNPVKDIAEAFQSVLDGVPSSSSTSKKNKNRHVEHETWQGIKQVIFAIGNRKMANDFAAAFGGAIQVEAGPGSEATEEEEEEEDTVTEELRTKIQEMESQLSQVWNPDLKARLGRNGSIEWIASAKNDEQKMGFLDLPRELRDLIYEFAFRAEGAILIYSRDPYAVRPLAKAMNIRHKGSGPIEPEPMRNGQIPVALVRTCRQLYAECSPVLYGINTFAFWTSSNLELGAPSRLVRHVIGAADPRDLFKKHLEEVSYWWKRRFWPDVLRTSRAMLERFPNLETLTIPLKVPPNGQIQRPVFLHVVNKTREQRVALAASWMKPRCSWEDERLRRCLYLEVLPPPGSLRDQYTGSRFVPEDDDDWDVTEFADAFQLMKNLT